MQPNLSILLPFSMSVGNDFAITWVTVGNSSKCVFVLISMLGRVKDIGTILLVLPKFGSLFYTRNNIQTLTVYGTLLPGLPVARARLYMTILVLLKPAVWPTGIMGSIFDGIQRPLKVKFSLCLFLCRAHQHTKLQQLILWLTSCAFCRTKTLP